MKNVGHVQFPSGKRLRVAASAGGIHGILEAPSPVFVGPEPVWHEERREPPIRTPDELLAILVGNKDAGGFVRCMLDAWAVVLELRGIHATDIDGDTIVATDAKLPSAGG